MMGHTCARPRALEQIIDVLDDKHVVLQQYHTLVLCQRPRRDVRQYLRKARRRTPWCS